MVDAADFAVVIADQGGDALHDLGGQFGFFAGREDGNEFVFAQEGRPSSGFAADGAGLGRVGGRKVMSSLSGDLGYYHRNGSFPVIFT